MTAIIQFDNISISKEDNLELFNLLEMRNVLIKEFNNLNSSLVNVKYSTIQSLWKRPEISEFESEQFFAGKND